MPCVSLSVDEALVSADGSGESWRRRSTCRQWIGCRHVCQCRLTRKWSQPTAVERAGVGRALVNTALATDGSVDSGSVGGTFVGEGDVGVSRRQLRELESAEDMSTVHLMAPRVSVSAGGGGGVSRRQ